MRAGWHHVVVSPFRHGWSHTTLFLAQPGEGGRENQQSAPGRCRSGANSPASATCVTCKAQPAHSDDEKLNWDRHGEPRVRSIPRRVVLRDQGNWRCPPGSTTRPVLHRAVGFILGCNRCFFFSRLTFITARAVVLAANRICVPDLLKLGISDSCKAAP